MSTYTDADVSLVANHVPLGFTERDPYRDVDEAARAILDAIAPVIAARALREAADAFAKAAPASAFVAGWTAAEMGLRARAANFYERTP